MGGTNAIAGMSAVSGRAIVDQGTLTYGAAGPIYEVPALANPDTVAQAAASGQAAQVMTPGLGERANIKLNP